MVKVISTEGVKDVPDEELTYQEHEMVIDHWEASWRMLHARGTRSDEQFEEDMAKVRRAREKLFSGAVPFKGRPS